MRTGILHGTIGGGTAFDRAVRRPPVVLTAAAAAAGLAFVLVSARALPLLGGILATLTIGCAGPWLAIAGATATIAWDRRRCRVGDTLTATITSRPILPWWRPRVALRWPDAEPAAAVVFDAAANFSPADAVPNQVAVVPRRRGRFPHVAPAVESSQPFGVVTARRPLALPAPVIVWPARAELRMPAGLVAAAGVGRATSERITGYSGDSIGARDYRAGDSMRSIHWAHTARRDAVVVRERPGAAAAAVRLIVDHRIHVHGDGREPSSSRLLDAIVGIAFAIVESWRPRGVTFELVWPGRTPLAPRTPADVTAMLDELACLEPQSAASAAAPPSTRPRPVDLEILLTTPPGRESLVAAVGGTADARHERLWIIVGGEPAAAGPQGGRGRADEVLSLPLEPDPIAAVDAAFASLNHDPDTRSRSQSQTAGRPAPRRRSHTPA
jgi:uncharacterized protein (DUF58 family)